MRNGFLFEQRFVSAPGIFPAIGHPAIEEVQRDGEYERDAERPEQRFPTELRIHRTEKNGERDVLPHSKPRRLSMNRNVDFFSERVHAQITTVNVNRDAKISLALARIFSFWLYPPQ